MKFVRWEKKTRTFILIFKSVHNFCFHETTLPQLRKFCFYEFTLTISTVSNPMPKFSTASRKNGRRDFCSQIAEFYLLEKANTFPSFHILRGLVLFCTTDIPCQQPRLNSAWIQSASMSRSRDISFPQSNTIIFFRYIACS